ncbi:MAG: LysM peptidoglycan-binding domain-containing protein [Planctomycetes bacterium]|nr:LysM peptidoglycan-binding domain-containing protein [Planctomycetota bacterium]NUQ33778.1 LysM peptidoglycan-binding domain-containing protein [Planctomycetaceae bacterium]
MDRGIKIAIVIACVLSLGLGLIWDSVIDFGRDAVRPENPVSSMSPDTVALRVGDMTTPSRARPVSTQTPATSGSQTNDAPVAGQPPAEQRSNAASHLAMSPQLANNVKDGVYTVQSGDNWWKIAYKDTHFKFLGKTQDDWKAANPDVVKKYGNDLRPGVKLTIPG